MKYLKDWVENTHIKVHKKSDGKVPDHNAGYYDWAIGFAVEKVIDDIKEELPDNSLIMNRLIELENHMKGFEYQMKALKDRTEEVLSKDAPVYEKKGENK